MSDIATRLRQTRANMIGTDDEDHYWDCQLAAGKIEALRAENEKLRAALKPFADIAKQFEFADDSEGISGVLLGDLRAARAALKETGNE